MVALFCSIDAVSDRDFVLEFLAANSITAVHLSRLGEEWVLWASEEFGFITPSDSVSTGSSIMPQKKNPDPMELVRGKSARVIGDLVTLLTLCKGLPLAYNRDLQVCFSIHLVNHVKTPISGSLECALVTTCWLVISLFSQPLWSLSFGVQIDHRC